MGHMQAWTWLVNAFHVRQRQPVGIRLAEDMPPSPLDPPATSKALRVAAVDVYAVSIRMQDLFTVERDYRALRMHLILEEAAEVMEALAARDENLLLDALADLSYVTVGTAVTYDLPLEWAFAEVHASNMTKAPRSDSDPRVRQKGTSYVPPDMESVLATHRRGILTGAAICYAGEDPVPGETTVKVGNHLRVSAPANHLSPRDDTARRMAEAAVLLISETHEWWDEDNGMAPGWRKKGGVA